MTTNKKLRIALYIQLIASIIFTLCGIIRMIDLKIEHFEDGSGRITYCLPFSEPWFGGCN